MALGLEGATDSVWFGSIEDALVHPSGKVIVLDRLSDYHLLVFSPKGHLLARLGRTGHGPGELWGPKSIAVGDDGRLFVLDSRLRRVSIFDVEPDVVHVADVRVNVPATDLCAMHGRLYLLGPSGEGASAPVIQEYEVVGAGLRLRRGFSHLTSRHALASSPLMAGPLSSGVVACASQSNSIIWASTYFGEVHWVSADDGSERLITIPQYSEVQMSIRGSNTLEMAMPKAGIMDETLAVYPVSDTSFLVEVGSMNSDDARHRAFTYYTMRVIGLDGRQLRAARSTKWLADWRGTRSVCVRENPTPAAWVLGTAADHVPNCQ